ncbi:MAG TPA: hypothetical protein VGY13_13805 [Solirubrobacteraceae bacterium]|jgi:hypothetical protein|nr:hypothetical protein [Solirubrobacteraceae bacterium]
MLTPVLIFLVAAVAGSWAASRWLPDLAAGPVGGLAFFLVCGLAGAALGLIGMHVYLMVREAESKEAFFSGASIASELASMAFDAGSVAGLAAIVYLLAPAPEEPDEIEESAPGAASA